jgi:succinate dehydrogenase / fumarate reductase iron-sulfur subunit
MRLHLRVWRQDGPNEPGGLVDYEARDVKPEMSILEMLDQLNMRLVKRGEHPIAFESDCREGICGQCGLVINGVPHGEQKEATTCELRMRHFSDGDTVTIEPFRAGAIPVIKDLIVDRTGLDRIIMAGGYVSVRAGELPDANTHLIPKQDQEEAMDAAECIGCGACAAACPNGSPMLFLGAKVAHLAKIPQGRPEAARRVRNMTRTMLQEGFGNCSNHYECQEACPKNIDVKFIARMYREYLKSLSKKKD